MTHTLHVTIDADTLSPSATLRATVGGQPSALVTERFFDALSAELGGSRAAAEFSVYIANKSGRPIGYNFSKGDGESRTVFMSPRGWSQERLSGYVAAHHEALEHLFGDATPVPLEDL